MTRYVSIYISQDFYSPTRFVVYTTAPGSQVVKNFHSVLLSTFEKLFTAHCVMNATCKSKGSSNNTTLRRYPADIRAGNFKTFLGITP